MIEPGGHPMQIREAIVNDIPALADLLRGTILRVNVRDYSTEQVRIWSAVADDRQAWMKRLSEQYFIVAESEGHLLGLASLSTEGYLDMLYVDADHQGLGVGSRLLEALVDRAREMGLKKLDTQASITARPFFEHHGFIVVRKNEKMLGGTAFHNWIMEADLTER